MAKPALRYTCPYCEVPFYKALTRRGASYCPVCLGEIQAPTTTTIKKKKPRKKKRKQTDVSLYERLERLAGKWDGLPAVREKLERINRRILALAERDGWDCWLCGEPVDPLILGRHRASCDRVLPGSQGGTYVLENVRLSHQSCNAFRSGAKTIPYAPFDNRWPADHERREAHEAYVRGLEEDDR